jgi:hypothetical protein
MFTSRRLPLLLTTSFALAALAAAGCAADGASEAPLDDLQAGFGIGKADGPAGGFTACELREVLKLVNESTTTAALLQDDVKVHAKAALRLVEHRVGPDGIEGNADDDLFDDLAELDGVDWVGPKALEAFADYARPRCLVDLDQRPYIDRKTWEGSTGGGWGRNAPEVEATMTVGGVTGRALYETLNKRDSRDRTVFSRLRKSKIMGAFSYGYAIDEMPWDSASRDARELLPYVALSIESGRFVPDEGGGQRELDMGTDIFDDIYYDTTDYELNANGLILRGRARWDSDTVVRRLLVQSKSKTSIDDNGIKQSAKVDVRTDSGERYLATLDDDVRGGTVPWSGGKTPVEAIKVVYDVLDAAGLLPDMQGRKGVLVLDPKAYLRSLRSRFHFNLTDDNNLTAFYANGLTRMREAVAIAERALTDGTVADADKAAVEALIALGHGIADGTLIAARAAERLGQLDPPVTGVAVYPQAFGGASLPDKRTLDTHQIVAETADALFEEFAAALDDLDREITGTSGLDSDEYVDPYIAFRVSLDPSLAIKTTVQPFHIAWTTFATQDQQVVDDQIAAFNAWAEGLKAAGDKDYADFVPMTQAAWAALGKHLEFEMLKISQRQITNAGTVANALWFELARRLYVPGAPSSAWSNFVIDTFDATYFVTPQAWEAIPEAERLPTFDVPGAAIYHTKVVNEVQIELTSVEPYIDRIEALTQEIAASGSTPEREALLAGARFVLDESIRTLQVLGELKGDAILDRLDDEGLSGATWGPAKYSKGETAMRILTDTDADGE